MNHKDNTLSHLRTAVQDYVYKHMYVSATFWADKAVSLSRDSPEDVYHFIQCLLHSGEYQRVVHLLSTGKWSALGKKHLVFVYLTARAHASCNHWSEVIALLEPAVEDEFPPNVYPNTAPWIGCPLGDLRSECHLIYGISLEKTENYDSAVEHYRKALQYNPLCYEALENLNRYETSIERKADVEKTLKPYLQKLPTKDLRDLVHTVLLSQIHTPTADTPPAKYPGLSENADFLVVKAERLTNLYEFEESYRITTRILQDDLFHSRALLMHLATSVQLKKKAELYRMGHRLVVACPDSPLSWYAAGCYYYCVGKQEEARRMFNKSTSLDKQFGQALLACGQSLAMEGERDHAIAVYSIAATVMKGCHLPKMYIGLEYMLTGNYNYAANSLEQAKLIAPYDPVLLQEIGVLYYHTGNYILAEKFFRMSLNRSPLENGDQCSPEWEVILFNLGQTYRKLGAYEQALQFYKRALHLKPDTPSTMSSIAHVHLLLEEYEKAIFLCESVLNHNSNDQFTCLMLNYAIEELQHQRLPFLTLPTPEKMAGTVDYNVINVTNAPASGLGRSEYLGWINSSLDLQLKKVEEMCTGAAYCQFFDIMFPGAINLKKIKFTTKQEYEYINNFKILQGSFSQLKVEKTIPIEKIVKGKFQDNFEFLQWFKEFYNRNYDPDRSQNEYDPVKVREAAGKKGGVSTRVPSTTPKSSIQQASPAPRAKPPTTKIAAKKTPEPAGPKKERVSASSRPESVNSELEKRLEDAQMIIAETDQKLKEYEIFAENATLDLEQCTKERDFYFSKLRKIEVIVQESYQQGDSVLESIQVILYETEEGFTLPPEEEPQPGFDSQLEDVDGPVGNLAQDETSETY
ncbi:hypothetical protein LOD99_12785 [Oopsacas minuta]|uniref:Uncharacterized protein n=1 Tax=Oopsacas minuta TaxID=111878 RepID=A0AAV7JD00_9METZ|nr:hypothetical protein LOD99_12785 [Oopsacas minuta]